MYFLLVTDVIFKLIFNKRSSYVVAVIQVVVVVVVVDGDDNDDDVNKDDEVIVRIVTSKRSVGCIKCHIHQSVQFVCVIV